MRTNKIVRFCALFLFLTLNVASAEEKKRYGLQELIEIAHEKNPSAALFSANVRAAKGNATSARAYPDPEIGIETGSSGEYSINISQPIERPDKRSYRRNAAEKEVEAAETESEDFHLELVSEVKKAFYRLLLTKKDESIAADNLNIAEKLVKNIENRVNAGEAPGSELVKAEVERFKAEKDRKKAIREITIAGASLNALLGGSFMGDFDVVGDFLMPETLALDRLLSSALERHPAIARAGKKLEARKDSLMLEKASVFPGVTVKGFYNHEVDNDIYGLGLSVPLPLWYQRKGEIATASAEKEKAEAEVEKIRIELTRAITEEYQNYLIGIDEIEVFDKGLLRQSEEALRNAELSYRHGESELLDYLDAQRVYRQTLLEYNRVFYELEIAVASLERAAGLEIKDSGGR